MAYTLVDSVESVIQFLDDLRDLESEVPALYVDVEGVNLSRDGTLTLMQVFVLPQKHTYLIDVHVLKQAAFTTANTQGQTWKGILEEEGIPKAFFDVRTDSDALFGQYQVALKGIHDIQVMEFAIPGRRGNYVNGLAQCILNNACISFEESNEVRRTKDLGKKLFVPELGGSYEIFLQRPMPEELLQYCVQDVHYLARLWHTYHSELILSDLMPKFLTEGKARVWVSQQPDYNGKGSHMAIGPWRWGSVSAPYYRHLNQVSRDTSPMQVGIW